MGNAEYAAHRVARARQCLDPATPLDQVTREAAERTRAVFAAGSAHRWRILLYAPLYLSSYCVNQCVYCGFRASNPIERRHLSVAEALDQAAILADRGFRHLLLVAGEFPALVPTEYFAEVIAGLRQRGITPAVEIAPQSAEAYAVMASAGACGVTLYQETYDPQRYTGYHPKGPKSDYDWRLGGHQRAAEAGLQRLGLGVLLGLSDPRQDLWAMIRHAAWLAERFPHHGLAFSLPRIYESPQGFEPPFAVDDELFVRMYCGLRAAFPRAELVLSTREPEALRSRLARICITQMSAGSSTVPGGYDTCLARGADGQFSISDQRSPAEVAAALEADGFELLWDVPPALSVGASPPQNKSVTVCQAIRLAVVESSLGWMGVAATERGVSDISFGEHPQVLRHELATRLGTAVLQEDDPQVLQWAEKVAASVDAPNRLADIPLDIQGTAFQKRVWEAICDVPPGTTATYTEIARRIGRPTAVRAVAAACGANRLAVVIPCHRIVRSDGRLGGYRSGIERKRALVEREARVL